MFIFKKSDIKICVYVVLLLVILLQYTQYLFLPSFYSHFSHFSPQANPNAGWAPFSRDLFTNNFQNAQNISFKYIIKEHSKYCYYSWRNYFFTINDCESWQLGSILAISGSPLYGTANNIFEQNRLNIQPVSLVFSNLHSAKNLMTKAGSIFQLFLWFCYEIKAFLLQKNSILHTIQTEHIVRAMILGDKSVIDPTTYHYFEVTGTLHVLAVSGMHVGLLQVLLTKLTSPFWPALRFFTQVALLSTYAIIVGLGPSVARATSMLLLALVTSQILKRQKQSWYVLASVVVLLLLLNDWFLFMVGFQLSVLATTSIIGLQMYRRKIRTYNYSKNGKKNTDSSENTWSLLFASVQTTQNIGFQSHSHSRESYTTSNFFKSIFLSFKSYFKEVSILSGFIQIMLAPLLWIYFEKLSWVGIISAPVLMWLVPPIFLFAVSTFGLLLLSGGFTYIGVPLIATLVDYLRMICSFFLELSVHLFLFLLSTIARYFDKFAFIELQEFSIITAVVWYCSVFLSLYVYFGMSIRKNVYPRVY